jgi:hypothetical protein
MSAINLRLPESLHKAIRELAKEDNISINQFITLAVAEKVSALMTEDYLTERANRASRAWFEAALSNVANTEPDRQDAL